MHKQINLTDDETLTWAIYESGSGILSLVLYAETIAHARPVAAVFGLLPEDVKPALADLDMVHMWEGVDYDIADIHTFLRDEATRPVAYSAVNPTGSVETTVDAERMGYAAKRAFGLVSLVG